MTSSLVFYPFLGKFDLDHWPWPKVKVIGTWVIECTLLGCTFVPSKKCVGEIASEIWPVLWFVTHFMEKFDLDLWPWVKVIGTWVIECYLDFYYFWQNLTLTFDLDERSRSSALGSLNVPYWVVPWYRVKSVGKIASEIWPVLWFFTHFSGNLTLTIDLDLGNCTCVIECA